ncbi:hypothetical protein HID58_075331 [Brassica napus]|uniref:F-box associated beta-propeller type 3 domain-containing protein n=1 Tax=Brassica napus TaxID=3708 RepID=A0ABQ7YJB9_BRANA|nr:hypothetical protein HID58_075331 [Brassica napus]
MVNLVVSKLWSSFFFRHTSMFYQLFGVSVLFEISESSAHRLTIREANRVLNPEGSNSHVYSFQYTNPIDLRNPLSDSVHVLILLRGFKLWNPSLRRITPNICPGIEKEGRFQRFLYEQLVVISLVAAIYPASLRISSSGHARNISPFCWSYLGYDPLQGKHKVLSIYQDIQTQVLTLGVQESWRTITKNSLVHCTYFSRGKCFNAVVYYEMKLIWTQMDTSKPYLHVPFKSEWRDRISYKRVTDAGELVFPDHIESLFSMHNRSFVSCPTFY